MKYIDHDIDVMWDRLSEKFGLMQKQIDPIMKDLKKGPACNTLEVNIEDDKLC